MIDSKRLNKIIRNFKLKHIEIKRYNVLNFDGEINMAACSSLCAMEKRPYWPVRKEKHDVNSLT